MNFGGFGSILKGIGKASATLGENSKVYRGVQDARQSSMNPWFNAKKQGPKNLSDTSTSSGTNA